jgi:hypothetical protein
MIKAPITLQDLRQRLYVKEKAESSWSLRTPGLRLETVEYGVAQKSFPKAVPA